jgi:hypothetical protein
MSFYGVIYGYRDPDTGKVRYVGQSENLARRHRRHLTSKLAVDGWLRSFATPPQPEILCEITGTDRQTFLNDMAFHETVAMFHHHTHVIYCPGSDGFNQTIPQSKDYQIVGRIGGLITHRRHPDLAQRNGKRQGTIQGPKNIASGQVRKLGLIQGRENQESGWIQNLGRTQGPKNAERLRKQGQANVVSGHLAKISTPENRAKAHRVANHIRWHVKRDLINPACKLCQTC